jgi:hypothetical protein
MLHLQLCQYVLHLCARHAAVSISSSSTRVLSWLEFPFCLHQSATSQVHPLSSSHSLQTLPQALLHSSSPRSPSTRSIRLVFLLIHSQYPPPSTPRSPPQLASQDPVFAPSSVPTAIYFSVTLRRAKVGLVNHVFQPKANLANIGVDVNPGVNACTVRWLS